MGPHAPARSGGSNRSSPSLRGRAAISLAAAGIALALVAVGQFVGWWSTSTDWNPWTIQGHEYHFQATTTFLPGPDYLLRCSTNNTSMPGFGVICAGIGSGGALQPYKALPTQTTQTGALYALLSTLLWIELAVDVLALAVLVLAISIPNRPSRRFAVLRWSVLLLATGLAIGVPLGVMIEQPMASAQDRGNFATGETGFWGSCHSTADPRYCGVNSTVSWGAGPGWYLSMSAGALFLVAAFALRKARYDPSAVPVAPPG